MARSILPSVIFILLLIHPSISFKPFDIINDTVLSIKNFVTLLIGGAEFSFDYLKFSLNQIENITPSFDEEFDFIIVGAGSAGATIASRLSEISDVKILLIESGEGESLTMDIPLGAPVLLFDKNIQWQYKTPLKDFCLGYKDKHCAFVTGKSMGGSSANNFIIATRGNKKNYDRWAEETGVKTWSYDGLLKYFKKLETCDVERSKVNPQYRGFTGPVRITDQVYQSSVADAFIDAGRELGFFSPNDYNGQYQTGFSYVQTNQIDGERLSSNRAYLMPIKNRTNLLVTMNSHVDKVLIDPKTKTAYGVEFTKYGKKIRVKVKKEVILSAGALGTPKLLMLSGIGPAKELQSLNISILQDAPVGENLIDHVSYPGLIFFVNGSEGLVFRDLLKPTNPTIPKYLTEHVGQLTSPAAVQGLAYINVDDLSPINKDPDFELILSSMHMGSTPMFHKSLEINETYFEQSFGDAMYRHGFMIWPVLMQPKSRGKLSLNSIDPKAEIIVDPNYYSHPDDIRRTIKAIKFIIKLAKTQAMKKYGFIRYKYTIVGCHEYEEDSDNFWECALRTFTQTLWHYSGTCKMGREGDPTAVVNPDLQVINITNLRIADASIMPFIPTSHLNIPTIAIGETASDIIKLHWGYTT